MSSFYVVLYLVYDLPACRTNARKHYFAIRVIEPWNSLKLQADHLSSLRSFTTFIRTADLKGFLHTHNNKLIKVDLLLYVLCVHACLYCYLNSVEIRVYVSACMPLHPSACLLYTSDAADE